MEDEVRQKISSFVDIISWIAICLVELDPVVLEYTGENHIKKALQGIKSRQAIDVVAYIHEPKNQPRYILLCRGYLWSF